MTTIRETLYGLLAYTEPSEGLVWRMTPVAFVKVRMDEDRTGELVTITPNERPICLGFPVNIVPSEGYGHSGVAFGDGKMVPL